MTPDWWNHPLTEPRPKVSATRRRTERAKQAIAQGYHPLGLPLIEPRTHEGGDPVGHGQTGRPAPADRGAGPGCGDAVTVRWANEQNMARPAYQRARHKAGVPMLKIKKDIGDLEAWILYIQQGTLLFRGEPWRP